MQAPKALYLNDLQLPSGLWVSGPLCRSKNFAERTGDAKVWQRPKGGSLSGAPRVKTHPSGSLPVRGDQDVAVLPGTSTDHSCCLSGLCVYGPISASPGAKLTRLSIDPAPPSSERRAPVQFPHSCQPDAPIPMDGNTARWPRPTLKDLVLEV